MYIEESKYEVVAQFLDNSVHNVATKKFRNCSSSANDSHDFFVILLPFQVEISFSQTVSLLMVRTIDLVACPI